MDIIIELTSQVQFCEDYMMDKLLESDRHIIIIAHTCKILIAIFITWGGGTRQDLKCILDLDLEY